MSQMTTKLTAKNVIRFAVSAATHERLKVAAARKNMTLQKLVREAVENQLPRIEREAERQSAVLRPTG